MQIALYSQEGKETGKVELNDIVFAQEVNEGLIHRALVYQLANARQVVAHTKTRGERRGSTRKLYRQKGTGRARMGSARSPIRKKGGVVFGPRNVSNFSLSMNKKERRKALFSALSAKAQSGLVIVDDIKLKEIKTKDMVKVINNLPLEGKTLVALPEKNEVLQKSASNIPTVKSLTVNYLNIHDLLKYENLLLTKSSLEKINEIFVK
ncbi:MAG: 50S ribosomal protein L4 [Candidatus Gracilibacteria bacterium]|nr:50S ribosomal protein L4 [Candidatus Gracilibacteria bacterium]